MRSGAEPEDASTADGNESADTDAHTAAAVQGLDDTTAEVKGKKDPVHAPEDDTAGNQAEASGMPSLERPEASGSEESPPEQMEETLESPAEPPLDPPRGADVPGTDSLSSATTTMDSVSNTPLGQPSQNEPAEDVAVTQPG